MTLSVSGDSITFPDLSTQLTAPSGFGFKNRIINGDMRIDQRNNGAAITINSDGAKFSTDRWYFQGTNADGIFTVQQSSIAPAGFSKSMLLTVTTADASIGASQTYFFKQAIEGFNIADLGWGAAGASPVTVSFWVRSSVTGTFGAAINNGAFNRSYPFSYTINAANTWEQKTVSIAGDTTGTWTADNSAGLALWFAVGAGATFLGTANTWAATGYVGATGSTNLISTSGATFYITGVQLEKGSTATAFDYRDYGRELSMCQRYLPAFVGGSQVFLGSALSTTQQIVAVTFGTQARVGPTGIFVSDVSHFTVSDYVSSSGPCTALSLSLGGQNTATLIANKSGGLTQLRPGNISSNSSSLILLFTGCEL